MLTYFNKISLEERDLVKLFDNLNELKEQLKGKGLPIEGEVLFFAYGKKPSGLEQLQEFLQKEYAQEVCNLPW